MSITANEVLTTLDSQAADFHFPGFNNMNYDTADARLHAHADGDRWQLIVEEVVDWPGAAGPMTLSFCFGNCLPCEQGLGADILPIETQLEYDDDADEILIPDTVVVRGEAVHVDSNRVCRQAVEHGVERSFGLLLELLETHREALFRTEHELRQLVPPDLPRVLLLEEWCHPDVYRDCRVNESEAFQQLAQVLATGDPSHYCPTEVPNSRDWKRWIDK